MAGETLHIGGTNLGTTAYITSWEGILQSAPYRGDLIELDFVAGAVWQAGPVAAYDFEVPLVMKSQDHNTAVQHALAILALAGTQTTVTRVFTSGASTVTQTCQGIIKEAIPLEWDLAFRSRVGVTLVITNLSGTWTTV
jgi:hypothetical protein